MKIAVSALTENDFLTADALLTTRSGHKRNVNIVIFWFGDQVYAYVNRCMHMQKPLNCQLAAIFDRNRNRLRCSMHGFVFEPETGTCLSPVCEGQRLQKVKLIEADGLIGLSHKQGQITAVYRNGMEPL